MHSRPPPVIVAITFALSGERSMTMWPTVLGADLGRQRRTTGDRWRGRSRARNPRLAFLT